MRVACPRVTGTQSIPTRRSVSSKPIECGLGNLKQSPEAGRAENPSVWKLRITDEETGVLPAHLTVVLHLQVNIHGSEGLGEVQLTMETIADEFASTFRQVIIVDTLKTNQ